MNDSSLPQRLCKAAFLTRPQGEKPTNAREVKLLDNEQRSSLIQKEKSRHTNGLRRLSKHDHTRLAMSLGSTR